MNTEGCEDAACSVTVEDGEVCPGGTVYLEATGSCLPPCYSMIAIAFGNSEFGSASGSVSVPCDGQPYTGTITVTANSDAPIGAMVEFFLFGAGDGLTCSIFGNAEVRQLVNLSLGGVAEADEETPGGFLCVNDDDDNNNGTPDKDEFDPQGQPTAVVGENDLVPLAVTAAGTLEGTLTLSLAGGASAVRLYENANRTVPVLLPKIWTLTGQPPGVEVTYFVEGASASIAVRDVDFRLRFLGDGGPCQDSVKLTIVDAKLDPVTAGMDPVPLNPAIIAPVEVGLDDFSVFLDGNRFHLTHLAPNLDLTTLPVQWSFLVTSGFLAPNAQWLVDPDRRGAQMRLPFPSSGNLGTGEVRFELGGRPCASVETLIRNIQPDLEPGDFRFHVKAHLCVDSTGAGTTRTPGQIRTIMSDVTKVLSQCGIIVTTATITTTIVDSDYLNLDSTALFDMWFLFGNDEDDTDIDVFFIPSIDFHAQQQCGQTSGLTGTPQASGIAYEAGVAIGDNVCDGTGSVQEVVRTLGHEIVHYLMNHGDVGGDHVENEPANLMSPGVDQNKRDMLATQCSNIRNNHEDD